MRKIEKKSWEINANLLQQTTGSTQLNSFKNVNTTIHKIL